VAAEVRRVPNLRRYYLLKRLYAVQNDLEENVWVALQEAVAGTTLPATFPHRTALAGHGYSTVDDLDGADSDELVKIGFSSIHAKAIITAFANL
jgi:hypothetical protein